MLHDKRLYLLAANLGCYFVNDLIHCKSAFFDTYAEEQGASESTVGIIYAALPLFTFLGSWPAGKLIDAMGTAIPQAAGLCLLAASSIGFGFSRSVPLWILFRCLQGLAMAPVYTSISCNLANAFTGPGEFDRVNVMLEVASNLASVVAPIFGATSYQLGAFAAPFVLTAALQVVFLILLSCSSSSKQDVEEESEEEKPEAVSTCHYFSAARIPVLALVACLVSGAWGALEPALAAHFRQSLGQIPKFQTGLLIALPSVSATLSALFVPLLIRRTSTVAVIIAGLVMYGTSLLSFGLPHLLAVDWSTGTAGQWTLQLSAMLVLGAGWGLCWTPVLPSMMQAGIDLLVARGFTEVAALRAVSSRISAVFEAASAMGDAAGPSLGGFALQEISFVHKTCAIGTAFFAVAAALLLSRGQRRESSENMKDGIAVVF
mmetsp:Transcript_84524/g.149656  ORF Transcript_84524/g.149656 Transcript_84524/m.149656 type:complete len:432 (-) Transcript_84524:244-1539(-)